MDLKPGDGVLVRGGAHLRHLLEDIAYECYRVGALPMVVGGSDELSKRIMDKIPASTLERTPRHLLGAYEKMDCTIVVEPYDDPAIPSSFPRSKLEAKAKASVPLKKIIHGEDSGTGKKWCYAGWPTRKAAKFYGVPLDLLQKFIIGGMTVPISTLRRSCEAVDSRIRGAKSVHVTDPEGTDFEVSIKGRRINLDDGFVSEEDVRVNDLGNNLPAGEVFMAPHETRGLGSIFCPLTKDKLSGQIIRDVELRFERGKLDLRKCRAGENRDALIRSFKQLMRVDEKTQRKVRTLNVAELGIGCNPEVTKSIGYILTDEKITGSVHVAFGANFSYGGTSKSAMHWDFVTIPKVDITARLGDGTEVSVMRGGKLSRK